MKKYFNLKNLSRILLTAGLVFLSILAYLELLPAISQYIMLKKWRSTETQTNKLLKPEYKGKNPVEIGKLSIPKIKIKRIVLLDAVPENLDVGPCLLKKTAYPGTLGHSVIAGHRVTHNFPFRNIDKLEKGDKIIFSNSQGSMVFKVTGKKRYLKNEKFYVQKKPSCPVITLSACSPPHSATHRLTVTAEAKDFQK